MSENITNKPITKEQTSKYSAFEKVAGLIAGVIGFMMSKYLGFLTVILFLIPIVVGFKFPEWYMKRTKISYKVIKLIAWSNMITWFLPPLGVLTGFCALRFSNFINDQKLKYRVLGIIGIILAFANAALGILQQLNY